MLYFALLFGKRGKHSCSASAINGLSMVLIVDSLLSTLQASANHILHCEATYFIGSGYMQAVSLLRLAHLFLASCGFAAQRSLNTLSHTWLNLKKKARLLVVYH